MRGVVKVGDTGNFRYLVANEFICGRLALILGLPVPPGVIVRTKDDELAYVSLRFGTKDERAPPIIASHLVSDNPHVTAGIIAFDCWIANDDRHSRNIAYSRDHLPVQVFDHGHALLGAGPDAGIERLLRYADRPAVSDCLAPHATMSKPFDPWIERIVAIHTGLIEDTVRMVVSHGGLTEDESTEVCRFLKERKAQVMKLIRSAARELPKIEW